LKLKAPVTKKVQLCENSDAWKFGKSIKTKSMIFFAKYQMTSKLVGKRMKRIRFYLRLDIILWCLDEKLRCLDKIFTTSSPGPTKMDTSITRSKSLQEKHHHQLAIQVVSDTNSFAASLGRQFFSVGCPLRRQGVEVLFVKASWLPMGIFGCQNCKDSIVDLNELFEAKKNPVMLSHLKGL